MDPFGCLGLALRKTPPAARMSQERRTPQPGSWIARGLVATPRPIQGARPLFRVPLFEWPKGNQKETERPFWGVPLNKTHPNRGAVLAETFCVFFSGARDGRL